MATNCWKTTTKINGEESSRNRDAFNRLLAGADREKLGDVVEKSTIRISKEPMEAYNAV